jgi:hypothetical protein
MHCDTSAADRIKGHLAFILIGALKEGFSICANGSAKEKDSYCRIVTFVPESNYISA